MATNIYISPSNLREVTLTEGDKIPLPFSTADADLQTDIESSQAFLDGDIIKNNSYVAPQPDIQIFTTVDL